MELDIDEFCEEFEEYCKDPKIDNYLKSLMEQHRLSRYQAEDYVYTEWQTRKEKQEREKKEFEREESMRKQYIEQIYRAYRGSVDKARIEQMTTQQLSQTYNQIMQPIQSAKKQGISDVLLLFFISANVFLLSSMNPRIS